MRYTQTNASIVAVHGLGGHREESWTAHNNVMWIKDLLSADIENARILTFGYNANADIGLSKNKVDMTLREYSEQLIDRLIRARKANPKVSNFMLHIRFIYEYLSQAPHYLHSP